MTALCQPICEHPGWFGGFLLLWFIWVYLVFSFLLVIVCWEFSSGLYVLIYLQQERISQEMVIHERLNGIVINTNQKTQLTLSPCDGVCTEQQHFQKGLFWTAQEKWSRAQLRELTLCFLALCVTPRLLRSDKYSVVNTTHSHHSQTIAQFFFL